MKFWHRLTHKFKHQTPEGEIELAKAYRYLFAGNADRQQREMVLADFAARCGWNQVTAPATAEQRIWFNEGKRAAFAFVFSHLSLSPEDMQAFENAARHEAAVISQYENANN